MDGPPPPYSGRRGPPPPLPPRSSVAGSGSGPTNTTTTTAAAVTDKDKTAPPDDDDDDDAPPAGITMVDNSDNPRSSSDLIDSKNERLWAASTSAADPRTSSTQSLVSPTPAPLSQQQLDALGHVQSGGDGASSGRQQRTLLLVYIHGFYGNDQSFQSFPAHVHAYLRAALADTHSIHTKIYPRYKTYRAIEVARDNFSRWLEPHESPTTDVVLVGHSMGGLLAADIALIPNTDPYKQYPFKHRIIGTISLDSPFLGLHPGIVVAGLASIFQPSPKTSPLDDGTSNLSSPPPSIHSSTTDVAHSLDSQLGSSAATSPALPPGRQPADPFFNPPFANDAPFLEQPFMKRVMHFASKHKSDGLLNAFGNHVLSHLEYGGCLADPSGLIHRFRKIRNLEDVDEYKMAHAGHPRGAFARVRFVNYYTLSAGKPKQAKSPSPGKGEAGSVTASTPAQASAGDLDSSSRLDLSQMSSLSLGDGQSRSSEADERHLDTDTPEPAPPTIVLDDNEAKSQAGVDMYASDHTDEFFDAEDQKRASISVSGSASSSRPVSMQELDPAPLEPEEPAPPTEADAAPSQHEHEPQPDSSSTLQPTPSENTDPELPPLPPPPTKPALPDLSLYANDKSARKQAEKESKLLLKSYESSLKAHEKALRAREKHLAKRRKDAAKQSARLDREALQAHKQRGKEDAARARAEAKQVEKERKKLEQEQALEEAEADAETASLGGPRQQQQQKGRKFCVLPGKVDGKPDGTWVSVWMGEMDEVGAHCGLFFPGEHYDKLVGDVGGRVVGWVQEDMSKRAVLEE